MCDDYADSPVTETQLIRESELWYCENILLLTPGPLSYIYFFCVRINYYSQILMQHFDIYMRSC